MQENSNAKVIIVSEDDTMMQQLASVLSRAGMEPVLVSEETSCVESVNETMPVTVIVDEEARSGGWQLSTRIRRQSDVPIIMIGAGDAVDAWVKAAAYGVDFYAPKPLGLRELVARVEALARRHRICCGV